MSSEYELMKRRLDESIRKEEARAKILRAKREEKRSIKKAGGGKNIAAKVYSGNSSAGNNGTDFVFGHNEPEPVSDHRSNSSNDGYPAEGGAEIDRRIAEEAAGRCMGRVACQICKKFHGYCVEVEEEKEKYKMLPTGDGSSPKSGRKGGLNWIKIEDLNTIPTEAKILMVKYNEEGQFGPQVQLKLAFKGEIRFLGVKPTNKDPRYKALIGRFGPDENNWVNERILLFAEKDEFSEGFRMQLTIPEAAKSRR